MIKLVNHMQSTLTEEQERSFMNRLSEEDSLLNIGGVLRKMALLTNGIDACKFTSERLQLLRQDICLRFIEEQAQKIHPTVDDVLDNIDVLQRNTVEELYKVQEEYVHYKTLYEILRRRELTN